MAKRFTPIIGLAVVVALAMVAVFGAMSLTNPAFAAVGAPADAELAEREFQPQSTAARLEIVTGMEKGFDITSHISGGRTAVNITGHTAMSDNTALITVDDDDVGVNATNVELTLMSAETGTGRARVTVVIQKLPTTDPVTTETIVFDVRVVSAATSTPPTLVDPAPELSFEVGAGVALIPTSDTVDTAVPAKPGADSAVMDLSGHFEDGTGPEGGIDSYSISVAQVEDVQQVEVADAYDDDGAIDSEDLTWLPAVTASETGMVRFRATAGTLKDGAGRVTVTAINEAGGDDGTSDPLIFYVDVVPADKVTGPDDPGRDPAFSYLSADPGKNTRYELRFPAPKAMNTLTDEIVIELEDFTVPSSIDEDSIAVTVTNGCNGPAVAPATGPVKDCTTTPQDVAVSGEKIFVTVGDLDKASDDTTNDFNIQMNEVISVVIRQSAGISNPSEAGKYGPVAEVIYGNNEKDEVANFDGVKDLTVVVPRIISLSEEDGGLGDVIEATGKGFKNGTSLTFFVDKAVQRDDDDDSDTPMANDDKYPEVDDPVPNGKLELGEDILCVAEVGGDDVGTCEFTVSSPTFSGGPNYVNAVDGRSNIASEPDGDDSMFVLKASIAATPAGGSPGETILIQLVNFPKSTVVNMVELAREAIPGSNFGTTDAEGNANFSITIPNDVTAGKQELRVTAGDEDASKSVVISGPGIKVTPGEVVANQRVSLVGSGFTAGSKIGDDQGDSSMSIGGDPIHWSRINGSNDVVVDNGGNWSAAVDLPLTNATTTEGSRVIRVTDSADRTGSVVVTILARRVTITPSSGRVGTEAVVRGWNFPSKNDEGNSFNIQIVYDAVNGKTTVSANPDASGRFETQLRIPTTADIPSTNTLKVSFQEANNGPTVVTTVTHDVPEGAINLSSTSGAPGRAVTVNGVGFKSFVPVKSVMVGSLEVTPSPRPSTDSQGMMSFDITIPGLDVGIQTIEVKVGGTTASVGFTVTPSGVSAGDITASAEAIVNLGDNFVRSFNFNNDTKTWTFYSPEAPDDSTQTSFITRESYWILIGESQEVILNGKTRNLTCGAGNCWNQIVW